MDRVIFAIPGDLETPTGGYAYDRRVLAGLPEHGLEVSHLALPGSFPSPSPDDLVRTEQLLAVGGPDAALLIDGLAFGALPPDLVNRLASPILALVHHPLGLEAGLPPERAVALLANERAALASTRRAIVTSPATARLLATDFAVPAERIVVAEPGTDRGRRARAYCGGRTGEASPVRLLAVGAVSPRKGYGLLVEALAGASELGWHLTIAGALDRAPAETARLREAIAVAGLADRITLAGAVDDETLASLYESTDVMVSPSLFEGYGMALAEALAHGLPIVTSTGGAAQETVPDAAGLKVLPGHVGALRGALRRIIRDERLRRACADAAWAAGRTLPRWSETVRRIAQAVREIRA